LTATGRRTRPPPCGQVALEEGESSGVVGDGAAGSGGPHGLGAGDQSLPELLLQELDALTHGRRGQVEASRGSIQGALVDDGGQGVRETRIDHHEHS
jgi:hypothetical protein